MRTKTFNLQHADGNTILIKSKGRLAIIILLLFYIPQFLFATPLSSDIKVTEDVGIKGGSLMAEDPETDLIVDVIFPEGAIPETRTVTLVIHETPLSRVLGKTHIKGISVLPEGLLLQEKAYINIYNPPVDVTEAMIIYMIINPQFIIPLGSQVRHEDEGWIEGTFYVTGKYSLGSPSTPEIVVQSKKLAAYNPASSLAYSGIQADMKVRFVAENSFYDYQYKGGPAAWQDNGYFPGFESYSMADEECLRWQKTLTKVEAHLTWVEQHKWTGNTEGERSEQANAEKALQDAINEYLRKPLPTNKCGSYIKAAAKYLESAILLGMDTGGNSPIAKHFSGLVDECSFVFTVETREWIDHPREEHDDGSVTEEKMNRYGTIKCHIPWNEFLVTGDMKVKGEGNITLHHENHWIGGDQNTHEETNTNWEIENIEGSVRMNFDEYSVAHPVADVTLHWKGQAQTRIWGKRHGNPPYDLSGTDDRPYVEHKSYPVENGYSEQIGDDRYGYSVKVFIVKQPGDERDDPDDCF